MLINTSKEPILFSEKIFKINRWSLKQERILVLTVRSVYIFRKKCRIYIVCLTNSIALRKKLLIEDLRSIVKSLTSNEFILHFPSFFDIRMQCERRDDFLNIIKLRFAHLNPKFTLKVYGVVRISKHNC